MKLKNWSMIQEQLLWRSVSALHHIFKDYQHIRGVKIQIFMNDNISEPSYTYEDKLE